MSRPDGCLVLEDGSVFRGQRMGDLGAGWGEVVFNTSMTGYQEMLTDPSYAGQILVLTYPLIGNYGVIPPTDESARIQVRGLVVRSDCDHPSHPLGGTTVDAYLRAEGVPGLAGVDTRAITRRIRERGVMQGLIVEPGEVDQAKARLADLPQYDSQDFIEVGTRAPYGWDGAPSRVEAADGDGPHIVVLDEGLKYNILRMLRGPRLPGDGGAAGDRRGRRAGDAARRRAAVAGAGRPAAARSAGADGVGAAGPDAADGHLPGPPGDRAGAGRRRRSS